MSRHHVSTPVGLAALLALLAMFGPFTIDAFFPAFNTVGRELHANPWLMQQTISVYLLAYALTNPFHGPLSDAYGRRPVVLWGVAIFAVASIGCVFAQSIGQLLFFRIVQGMSTGAGLIVGRAIVRDLYDGPQAQKVMSMITLFFGVAPALAPMIGGLVFELAGWRAVFAFLALYGVILYFVSLRALPETHRPEARTPFAPRPMLAVYRRIVLDSRFQLLVLATSFNFGATFLYMSSAPAFVERLLGLGTMGYSWFFVPMILGMMAGAALSNRLAGAITPRATVATGYVLMAVGMGLNAAYNLLAARIAVPWAVLPIGVHAAGVALAFPSLSLKMLDRYPANRGAASSMQAFLWGLATSTIAGVLSPLVATSGPRLAVVAAVMVAAGWACWRGYARLTPIAQQS